VRLQSISAFLPATYGPVIPILITGAGPIGTMAAAVARHVGARHIVVTDINLYRLELAKKMGATRVVNAREENLFDIMKDLGMKEGFDVGLEMSGSGQAFRDMLAAMAHGSKVAMLGIPEQETAIDWNLVIFNGLTIKGIYGRQMFETWYKMTMMVQTGLDLTPIITHRFDYMDFEEGFQLMRSGKSGKVILNWFGE
jgi:threonine 3-dehydrogenase